MTMLVTIWFVDSFVFVMKSPVSFHLQIQLQQMNFVVSGYTYCELVTKLPIYLDIQSIDHRRDQFQSKLIPNLTFQEVPVDCL